MTRIEALAAKIKEAVSLRQQTIKETEALALAAARRMLFSLRCGASRLSKWLDPNREGISRVDPRFVHWTIRASREIEEYLSDTIRGATREGVNSKIVAQLPCRVPSLPEQVSMVEELDALQAHADGLKKLQAEAAAELAALLPSVLHKGFKGEL